MKSPENRQFVNLDVYFMTHSSTTGFSKEHYATYDEARKIVEEDRLRCESDGKESDVFVAANVGDNHFKIVGELIEDYRKSGRAVEDLMVVMFEQTKEYQIMPKKELTPRLWVKKPYVTYGPLEMVESMVRTNRRMESVDKTSFKVNDY
jgi:hypothetical protein